MALEQVLLDLGLNEKAARTYLALLSLGSTTIKPLADKAKVKRTSIYNFIDRLIEDGLVTRTTVRGRSYYQARPPAQLVELQRARAAQLERALPGLSALFGGAKGAMRMQYFEGAKEVRNIVREELLCRKEALYIWPGGPIMEMIGGARFMTEIDKQRIAKGVFVRTIRSRKTDVKFATSGHGPRFLRELRWAPEGGLLPLGMGLYDTMKVGFFSSEKENFGVLIESAELYQLLRMLYLSFWARCEPAKGGEG